MCRKDRRLQSPADRFSQLPRALAALGAQHLKSEMEAPRVFEYYRLMRIGGGGR
jgi:hypothetical protein